MTGFAQYFGTWVKVFVNAMAETKQPEWVLGLTRFLTLGSIGQWPIVVAIGTLPYPITFLCTDLISELWGEQKASHLVWVGLLLNGWVLFILWLGEGIDLSRWAEGVEMAGMRSLLVPRLFMNDLVLVAGLSLFFGFVASLYPAWRAVKIKPLDALRR